MKILHVLGGSINSGASKGALLLHQHLLKLGVDSNVLCEDYSNDNKIFSTSLNFKDKIHKNARTLIDRLPKVFYLKESLAHLVTILLVMIYKEINITIVQILYIYIG